VPALQQPFGQEVESHTQRPVVALHSCPDAHAAHAAPPVPHELVDSDAYGSHVPFAVQQPFGHEVASHAHCPLAVHSRPIAHALHVAPAAPHDVLDSPASASHVLLMVQQPGHDVPPQAHAPPEHPSPVPHVLHAAPPVPH
jgi:hypothetical protein